MLRERDTAEIFLSKYDLRVKHKYLGDDKPHYRDDDSRVPHYFVTVRRVNGPRLSYDFWIGPRGLAGGRNQEPTVYDILIGLGESSECSPDPDEVYEEFGEMSPSQAIGMARFGRRVRKFFTQNELADLRKISHEGIRSTYTASRRLSENQALKQTG